MSSLFHLFFPANWTESRKHFQNIWNWNATIALPSIRRALRILQMENPVLINAFHPSFGNATIGKLGEKLRIYYCYDEIGATKWAGKHGKWMEDQFLPKVDALITSSQSLALERTHLQAHTYTVNNGVDANIFSAKTSLRKMRTHPLTFGYIGSIGGRIDYSLLWQLLERYPDCKLLLVGPIRSEVVDNPIFSHPNVILPGSQSPDSLPGWMQKMDVGLIPFLSNEFTRHIYPMKINEYLAMGLPVVSTDFADLDSFSSVISIVRDRDSFARTVMEAYLNDNEEKGQERMSFAKKQSWEERGKQFSGIIRDMWSKKRAFQASPQS